MKVLTPEESKEITAKFLKHFGVYDKEKLEEYFKQEPPKQKRSFLWWIYKFFTASLPERMTIDDFFPPNNMNVFKKYYGESLIGTPLTFEDEEKYGKFYKALEKTLKENNLSLFYAMPTGGGGENKRVAVFNNILEGVTKAWPFIGIDIYIFSDVFSFLLYLEDDDAIVIYGSKKLMSDFKRNYPDYHTDFNL